MTDTFTVTRTFAAARELVWQVWIRPEHFAVWFGTEVVEVPLESVTFDVRVGGKLAATMYVPEGPRIDWEGEFTEVEPESRLAFTLTDEPGTDPGEPIVVAFTDVDGGTEVSLTQPRRDFDDEQVQATVAGYNGFFDSLERVLAQLRLTP